MKTNYFQILAPQNGRSTQRIILKTLFLCGMGHLLFDNTTFHFNLNTPEIIQRNPLKHPINPPYIKSHKWTDPEVCIQQQQQQYNDEQNYWVELMKIIQFSRMRLKLADCQHPRLENDGVIIDSLWDQESQRVITEAENELKQQMVLFFKQKQRLLKMSEFDQAKETNRFSKLNSKIRPDVQ